MEANPPEFLRALEHYQRRWPGDAPKTGKYVELLGEAGAGISQPFLRSREQGHFTGSAWLVSRDGQRVLLTHHRKLNRWLQLGGHADGETRLELVALREAEEESGLSGLRVDAEIFDLDIHWIPERVDVPGHWHYDVRHVVRATHDESFVVSEESHDLAWRDITAMAVDADCDESLRRMAKRWLERSVGNVGSTP